MFLSLSSVLLLLISFVLPAVAATSRTVNGKVPAARPAKKVPSPTDKLPASERQWAQRWMNGMSLRDEIAQLIVVTSYGEALSSRSELYRKYVHEVRDLHVGGMIVVNRVANGTVRNAEPYAMATFLNRMQKLARVPLLIGGDFERGASMRVAGTTKFPHLMSYGAARDLQLTSYLGLATAREARALGVQWVFAPDADVNNNPDNPIINTRSFGENPQDVAAEVKAFIDGAHSDPRNRVLVTVKHFPGHGDTSVDSHIGMATLGGDRERMNHVELVPFQAAISDGVDAVMTAHMSVPAIDPEPVPATVSAKVLTGLLRNDLNFGGLIVTDAMDMQGLARQFPSGEASVRALEAGADVLLMPAHPEEVIRAVSAAVQSGRISRQRIQQSVIRVLAAKARVGLNRNKLVDLESISDTLDNPEGVEKAQAAADKAVTLVKNGKSLVTLKHPDNACWFVLAESRYGQGGRQILQEVQKRSPKARILLFDPLAPMIELEQAAEKITGCEVYVVPAFVSAAAYRGNVALAGSLPQFVGKLIDSKIPLVMIAMGNPYLLRAFPNVDAYLATYSTAPTSETAAVKALYGEIPITGKLPVTIPGLANYGDGLQLSH